VEVAVPVETTHSFPALERYAVPSHFPRGLLPIGKPFPHASFPISQPYVYPEAITNAWPGKFQGLSPFPLKEGFPFHHYGH
jgi:hypothetical protein